MKNILSIILLFCSISIFGQRSIKSEIINIAGLDVAMNEYKQQNSLITDSFRGTVTYAQGTSGNYALAGFSPSAGKAYFLKGIWISTTRTVQFQIIVNQNSALISQATHLFIVEKNKPYYLPLGIILRNGFSTSTSLRAWYDSDQTDAVCNLAYDGIVITDDVNTSAKNTILWIGDSILNGTGATATLNMYAFQTRYYMTSQGASVRNLIKAISGTTTTDHLKHCQNQVYNIKGVKQIIISLGTNDAGQSISKATYKANLKAMIDILLNNEDLPNILVLSNPPVENSTSNGFVTQYVTALSEIESEYNSSRVKTLNISAAFDRTSSSFYASSDTAGSRVHPNDVGNAAIYTVINTYLQTVSGLAIINALK